MDADGPGEPAVVDLVDVHEGFEHLDRADRDDRNHQFLLEAAKIDLGATITQGIAACVEHLGSDSESFSLPAIRKWARLMTDQKNKKGWPVLFADRRGLYSTLTSLFEAIKLQGAPGGLRGMYADFLLEAAAVVDDPRLMEPAQHYAALAAQWHALAEAALPDSVPQFKRGKTAASTARCSVTPA